MVLTKRRFSSPISVCCVAQQFDIRDQGAIRGIEFRPKTATRDNRPPELPVEASSYPQAAALSSCDPVAAGYIQPHRVLLSR
jgi:hypothetical protein